MRHRLLTTCTAGLPFLFPFALVSGATLAGPTRSLSAATCPADPEPAKVTLQTDDQQALAATYFAPIDTKQKAPAALLVHDTGGSRADLQALALRLQKSGFAVLTLDLRGHGDSATHELAWKQLDNDGQLRAWNSMPRDVKAGVEFLTTHEGVLGGQVSLLGRGAGAMLITQHAVRDERVKDLVLIDPKTEVFSSSLIRDLQQLGGLPTLIVVGKGDVNAGKRITEASARATSAHTGIDVKVAKLDSPEILTDKSMYGDVSRWMLEKLAGTPPKN